MLRNLNATTLDKLSVNFKAIYGFRKDAGVDDDVYANEECAELIKAISKFKRNKASVEDVIDECVDVLNTTISYLYALYGGPSNSDMGADMAANIVLDRMLAKTNRCVGRYLNGEL